MTHRAGGKVPTGRVTKAVPPKGGSKPMPDAAASQPRSAQMVTCIYCMAEQTHRVCAECFAALPSESSVAAAYRTITKRDRLRLLDLCGCEGGAAFGYMQEGWHVTSVDLDRAALKRNPADVTVLADALAFLAEHGHEYDAIHASFPCQKWSANGANPAAADWPDLITPGRELLIASGRPWVMENVPKAPLRRDLILCGTMFGLTTMDTDGTLLHLKRHRVFESNVPMVAPNPCVHPTGVQWGGVYGGARKDKVEARTIRKGGYVPPDADVQSDLLGGVDWMTGKGRRECIPWAYSEWIGGQLRNVFTAEGEAA